MKHAPLRHGHHNEGMVMLATVFLLLVLLPITVVFVRWVTLHRKGTAQARVHIKEFYAGITSSNIARYRIQKDAAFRWGTAVADTTISIGDGTTVTVEIKSVATP